MISLLHSDLKVSEKGSQLSTGRWIQSWVNAWYLHPSKKKYFWQDGSASYCPFSSATRRLEQSQGKSIGVACWKISTNNRRQNNNLNPGKRNEWALSGYPLLNQPGDETEPYSSCHCCQCKTNNTPFFFHPQMDLVIILRSNYHKFVVLHFCLPATSHFAPSIFSKLGKLGIESWANFRTESEKEKYWACGS